MRQITLLVIAIILISFANAQSIEELKNNCNEVKGGVYTQYDSGSEYGEREKIYHTWKDYEKISNIFTLDVFGYFNLYNQYDTDLKQKVYKQSKEYNEQLADLKNIKEKQKTISYYLDFVPVYKDKTNREKKIIELGT